MWEKEWGGCCIWSTGTNRSCGVAIMLNPRSNLEVVRSNTDYDGRVVSITIMKDDTEINVMNVYGSNKPNERKVLFDNLWRYRLGDQNFLLTGDFNCIANLDLDKIGGNPLSGTQGIEELRSFVDNNNLVDTWRLSHPHDKIFTWSNATYTLRSRLDRWYIPHHLHQTATAHIRACPHSDHSVTEVNLTLSADKIRGRGIWKFNNDLLKDTYFLRDIRAFHIFWKTKRTNFENIQTWWDEAKIQYKKIAVEHGVRKSKQRWQQERNLTRRLTELKNELHPNRAHIQVLEMQLNELVEIRLKGIKTRSRVKWQENGEKPTKYFFNLEKRKQSSARITRLQVNNKSVTTDSEILETARVFYQNLYSEVPKDTKLQDELLGHLDNVLSEIDRQQCEGPITKQEMNEAIKKMHLNKSPGPDGLTIEFYRAFWDELANDLCQLYNTAYEAGHLTDSQKTSILRLLFKKGERSDLKNWRPIALLNTDYKILSKVLANRLRPTLANVIQQNQTCGIPGRSIYDSINILRDMAHDVNTRGTSAIFINLDQEKAFDKISRDFLLKVLQKMNYGPSFQRWIQTLYDGANCKIINNGHLSETVWLHRGVRQGCPLSPLLYVLGIEVLIMAINKNNRIYGLAIPGSKIAHKISAYADDATLTLKDAQSVLHAFDTIKAYELATGSKLNMTKTEGLFLGGKAGNASGPIPITWQQDALNILGTKIGNTMTQDWGKVVKKLETTLDRWKLRHLTMKGKSVLIKTYALAHINFLATVFPIPAQVLARITRLIFKFLWNDKNELVSRESCQLPFHLGGLGIPDLHTNTEALLLKWIKTLTDPLQNKTWMHYGRYWLGFTLAFVHPDWIWLRNNLTPHGDPNNMPPWYQIITNFVQKHREQLSTMDKDHINAKTLAALSQEVHEPRCIKEWRRYVKQPCLPPWKYLWQSMLENKAKEVIWKIMHRVLTTKAYLASWGMNISVKCPFCNDREDMYHALIGCGRASRMWTLLQQWLKRINGNHLTINLETIAFATNLPIQTEAKALLYYIIGTAAYTLWKTRNKKVLKPNFQEPDIYQQVIDTVRSRMNQEASQNCSRLAYIWNYKNILCTYENGHVIVNI